MFFRITCVRAANVIEFSRAHFTLEKPVGVVTAANETALQVKNNEAKKCIKNEKGLSMT